MSFGRKQPKHRLRERRRLRREAREPHTFHQYGRPVRTLEPGWISAAEIASFLGVSQSWVRRHLTHLAVKHNARDYRWRSTSVADWLVDRGIDDALFRKGFDRR